MAITVDIVDNDKLVVTGLRKIIDDSGFAITGREFYTIAACREGLKESLPDILLLDIRLNDGNGIDFCREAVTLYPGLKIIMVSIFCELSTLDRSLDNGACGYLPKNVADSELLDAIRTVANDKTYIGRQLDAMKRKSQSTKTVTLNDCERSIVNGLMAGKTREKIASEMPISLSTVKWHINFMFSKFKVHNSTELIALLLKEGHIFPPQ
jgi:DNA-binding NarL/FixJ family response regulator